MRTRTIRFLLCSGIVSALLVAVPGTSLADGVQITTPYPAVAVSAGDTVSFDLTVIATGRQRVDLAVTDAPQGWTTTLRGGGFIIDGITTDSNNAPEVQLSVKVPQDASAGVFHLTVKATAADGSSDSLALDLRVGEGTGGSASFSTDFPAQQGTATDVFSFDLTLSNDTPKAITFSLAAAQQPPGWQVDVHPSGQQQATTVSVDPGATAGVQVSVDPPDDTTAGQYQVDIVAVGGGQNAELPLTLDITGNFALTLQTADQRLSTDAQAGKTKELQLIVQNNGTAPLTGISFSASPPQDWDVTFSPDTIDSLAPGDSMNVVASIKPASNAVAGDYDVTISANGADANSSIDVRTTVKTSSLWGIFGIALIVAALAGLGYVFRRYGRR
jgi:uncharacterized membrane protein